MATKQKRGKKVTDEDGSIKEAAATEPAAAESLAQATAMISKMDMVRAAIESGAEKPKEGVAFIAERWGVQVPTTMFSAYKTVIRKKKTAKKTGGGGVRSVSRPRPAAASPVEIIRGVRGLIEKYGRETVREVADALTE